MTLAPHYLLFTEAGCSLIGDRYWRFALLDVESNKRTIVSDMEPEAQGERLELLAVVRGLESLNGPAKVTLVTKSRYVSRGIKNGLMEWRANDWQWERFGRQVAVKDCDLWQRVDRAMLFHQVVCQAWQFEAEEEIVEAPAAVPKPLATPKSKGTRYRLDTAHRPRTLRRYCTDLANRATRWSESSQKLGRQVGHPLPGAV